MTLRLGFKLHSSSSLSFKFTVTSRLKLVVIFKLGTVALTVTRIQNASHDAGVAASGCGELVQPRARTARQCGGERVCRAPGPPGRAARVCVPRSVGGGGERRGVPRCLIRVPVPLSKPARPQAAVSPWTLIS